jgi:hypothetical protein
MPDVKCGFINSNNLLLEIIVFNEGDTDMMELVKNQLGAHAYHELIEPYGPAVIQNSIWTGEYFTPGSRFKTWIWNIEKCMWVPPVEAPVVEGKLYEWSDDLVNWVEVSS